LSTVRRLPSTIAGNTAYAVATTAGTFCLFVTQLAEACTLPLTDTFPAFVDVSDPGGTSTVGPTVFGIAEDGVGSISFTLDGVAHTVPVENNTFAFSATTPVKSDELADITAKFTDGHSVAIG
jgi:hypothetical protein